MAATFAQRLLAWFDRCGRTDMPWRREITPYRIWISEIMLQQTQVSTVIPYFARFTAAFPDVHALAAAPLDQVLHLWTGLGYYARARNLRKAAAAIVDRHGGEFPAQLDDLIRLPGIGRSTAGAILAIAFQHPAPILDGNAKRVLARHGAVAGWPGQASVASALWRIAETLTPHERAGDYTQAIMDLGATLCTRARPDCRRCPVRDDCAAFHAGDPADYPGKKPKVAMPVRRTLLLVLKNAEGQVLLARRPPIGIWGGLWSFPECPSTGAIAATCNQLGYAQNSCEFGELRRHTFSHYHLDYTPAYIEVAACPRVAEAHDCRWVDPDRPGALGLPKPVATLLEEIASPPRGPRQ